jgi:hypothetical protein
MAEIGDEKNSLDESNHSVDNVQNPEPALDAAEEKDETQPIELVATESDDKYLSGPKLWVVLGAVSLVLFLVMLDMSVVVTVCFLTLRRLFIYVPSRLFPGLQVTSTHWEMSDGMAVPI